MSKKWLNIFKFPVMIMTLVHYFGKCVEKKIFKLVGVLYGTTSVAVGHPFDTIKTKMQAQRGFETEGMFRSFAKTVKTQGIRGLYRYIMYKSFLVLLLIN